MMAPSFCRSLRSLLLTLAFISLPFIASAQVDNVYVYGTVKDYVSSKKLDGITVTVYKNGGKLAEVVTNASGKYEFNLDYGSEYKLVYSRTGMVSKNIAIDTRNIPEEERVGGHGMNVEMTLFAELPGIDFSVLQQPIGKAKFDGASKEVTWDLQYTEQVRAEIQRLMKEYDEKKKREANAEEDYNKLMAQGDASMGGGDYKKAVESFTGALGLKPNDARATAKLSDAKMKLDQADAAKKQEEQYAALIKEADGLFGKKDYEGAKAKYTQASDIKDEAYPKQKIKECQAFIDELAKQAEADRKKKEIEEKYKAAITAADAAFKAEKYGDAQARYTDATGIKPEEKYPKDQLAAIAKKLEELAKKEEEDRKKKELDGKYQAAIVAADAAFKGNNFDQAKAKYTEASELKPEEKYPKDQLAAIAKKLEELAQKEAEAKKAKELEEAYKSAIAKGDAAFKADNFDEAKAGYNEALGLKPKEKYPTDQLAAIEKRIAELAKKAEEDKKKKELDDAYNAAIASADNAFKGQTWEEAKGHYNEALKLKPQEKYPKDQLVAIEKAIADAAKKAQEEKAAQELQAKYKALIDAADGLMKSDKLEDAKPKYQEALGVKPAESYPKEKIAEIDATLAERARKAEEERKKKELDDKYNALIAKADKNYDGKKYADALNDYKDALGVKPDEQHPKDRIADIKGRLDAEAQAKAEKERLEREKADKDKRYNDAIAAADRAFKAKDYAGAKSGYGDASNVKPEEQYPKDRIAEIDKLLADMASKAEADSLKAAQEAADRARAEEEARRKAMAAEEIETRYREAVAKGDMAFKAENFDDARERYTEALTIKPEEKYPKDRIAAIEQLLADRLKAKGDAEAAEAERKRLEEERRRKAEADAEAARLAAQDERARLDAEKAKEEEYKRIIAEADGALSAKNYEDARSKYTMALDVKPQEVYPKSKIEQIDKLLADLERAKREAELAAQKQAVPEPEPERKNSTIDIKKEIEAEEFMRQARMREEQEKYERIKKLKADHADSLNTYTDRSTQRRGNAARSNQTLLESNQQEFSGSDAMRRKYEEELAAFKQAWEERHRTVADRNDQVRTEAYASKEQMENGGLERGASWNERHDSRVEASTNGKEAVAQAMNDRANAATQRTGQAREQIDNLLESDRELHDRGRERNKGLLDQVNMDKERHADREQQQINRSTDSRLAAQEQLGNLTTSEQRSFADYNRSKLANEYPQGVTEESATEGNKVIIRRVVVQGNKADEYKKVIGKSGTFYFKNGQTISEWIWSHETEE